MVVIHLMHDEKFLDSAIELFENINGCRNIYFVCLPEKKMVPFFIKSSKIKIIHNKDDVFKELESVKQINGIIIHYYDNQKAQLLIALKKEYPKSKVFWFAWGADFYSKINYPLYDKRTSQALLRKQIIQIIQKQYWKGLIINFLTKPFFRKDKFWNLGVPLIDYCSPVLPNEYNYLLKIKKFKAIQIQYSYSNSKEIDSIINRIQNLQIGNNVLIGNSATPSNNHLDIFQRIKREELVGKLIVPLNYGTFWYKELIKKEGKLLFGEYFYPIVDFMQKEDYFDLISSCGVVIFNHYRQQAMGNSSAMLYFGARVYLSEKSIAYQYYKSLGIHIYSLENDFAKYKFTKLEMEKVIENREKMNNSIYNKEKLSLMLNNILQKMKN